MIRFDCDTQPSTDILLADLPNHGPSGFIAQWMILHYGQVEAMNRTDSTPIGWRLFNLIHRTVIC